MRSCAVVWVIRDRSISATFVDAGAAEFLMPRLLDPASAPAVAPCARRQYRLDETTDNTVVRHVHGAGEAKAPLGGALGPDWAVGLNLKNVAAERAIRVEYEAEVARFWEAEAVPKEKVEAAGEQGWPLYVELSNGKVFGCDFLVSATGVTPNTCGGLGLKLGADGGFAVDETMATSRPGVFAAGDCACAAWEWSPHWFQMRLWCQARQMAFQVRDNARTLVI